MMKPSHFDPWAALAEMEEETEEQASDGAVPSPNFSNLSNFSRDATGKPKNDIETSDTGESIADGGEQADWCKWFEERLAVAMLDGEQSESDVRRIAWECCVVRWLDLHPAPTEPGQCAWCDDTATPGNIVPFGTNAAGHTWLHPRCWQPWIASRRKAAEAKLKAMGIGGW